MGIVGKKSESVDLVSLLKPVKLVHVLINSEREIDSIVFDKLQKGGRCLQREKKGIALVVRVLALTFRFRRNTGLAGEQVFSAARNCRKATRWPAYTVAHTIKYLDFFFCEHLMLVWELE